MRRNKLPQLGIVIVVCALVGALAGIAGSAAAPSKSSSKSAKKSATGKALRFAPRGGFRGPGGPGRPGFGPGGPAVHAEAVVPNKAGTGFITVTSDAGKITSISGNDVTIDESVGTLHYKDATVTIPSGATVIRNHAKAAVSDLKAGDFIRVISSSESTFVMAEDAAFRKSEQQRFGRPGGFDHHGPPPAGAPMPQDNGGAY